MELKEFLQKFSPNYNDIEKEALVVEKEAYQFTNTPFSDTERNSVKYELLAVYFPVALQNFADKICEAQRELCANEISFNTNPNDLDGYIEACKPIINAPAAKIDEL
jgi:hypothetical protein